MILFLLSLLAGILTVLAPCTISLLPVIVGGSIGEKHTKLHSFVVALSLGVSVIVFTLILKVSTLFIHIPQSVWQIFSGVIIFVLGVIMLFPNIWEHIPLLNSLNMSSNRLLATGYKKKGFVGDIIMGAALGPVFSSCSPTYFLILATVLPKSIAVGMIYLLAYVVGLCGFLLLITILSQKAIEKLGVASDDKGWIKRTVGVIFLALGIAIMFGFDQKIELFVSKHVFDITTIEQGLLKNQMPTSGATNDLPIQPTRNASNTSITTNSKVSSGSTQKAEPTRATPPKVLSEAERIAKKSFVYPHAPEITNPSGFVNTDGKPIQFSDFKEKKVVLVDFWTYSCINCQRTIPYLNAWYKKYKDQGLVIIGVHTPEFSFEKVQKNVEDGVKRFGIEYPVVLDNDYGTWTTFRNQYWPREYLIDIDGFIVHDHTGEGAYDETERAIQAALAERASVLGSGEVSTGIVKPANAVSVEATKVQSPETYFGSERNVYLANGNGGANSTQNLTIPSTIFPNALYLSGTWNFTREYAEAKDAGAKIIYKYNSKDVYFVASSEAGAILKILIDGQPVVATMKGEDIKPDGTVSVKENRLYKIIGGNDYGEHTLEIDLVGGTLDAYTFTFG